MYIRQERPPCTSHCISHVSPTLPCLPQANVKRGVDAVAEAASNHLSNPSIPATKSLPPEASLSANPVPVAAIPAAVATVPQQPTSGASSAREGPEGASSDQQQSQAPRLLSANKAAAGAAGASSIAAGGAGNVRDDREQARYIPCRMNVWQMWLACRILWFWRRR